MRFLGTFGEENHGKTVIFCPKVAYKQGPHPGTCESEGR